MSAIRSNLSEFLNQKDSVVAQFVKYVFCGGASVLVDQLLFYSLAWLVFPALRSTDPVAKMLTALGLGVQEVSEERLRANYWIIKGICFIASNSIVYVLNVRFVFRGGRYRRGVEVAMFFCFSLLQFFYIWLGGLLIDRCSWEVTNANLSMLVLGVLSNYIIRKKIVFKS